MRKSGGVQDISRHILSFVCHIECMALMWYSFLLLAGVINAERRYDNEHLGNFHLTQDAYDCAIEECQKGVYKRNLNPIVECLTSCGFRAFKYDSYKEILKNSRCKEKFFVTNPKNMDECWVKEATGILVTPERDVQCFGYKSQEVPGDLSVEDFNEHCLKDQGVQVEFYPTQVEGPVIWGYRWKIGKRDISDIV